MGSSLRVCWLEVDAEREINILVPTGLFPGFICQLTPPLYGCSGDVLGNQIGGL